MGVSKKELICRHSRSKILPGSNTGNGSDLDYMIVDFEPNIDTNVSAIVDTDNSPPGYLRLRDRYTGELISYPTNNKTVKKHLGPEKYSSSFTAFIRHGPALKGTHSYDEMPKIDFVLSSSWPKWPQCAEAWIRRKREWPSLEIIQEIISKGCHIVYKSYKSFEEEKVENEETEFRFSFSIAEARLFESLSPEQKQCFIAFKVLVKYTMYKIKSADAKKLTTYHLKNVFLYTCKTIPADRWQTTDGWGWCLLRLINRLANCLRKKKIWAYFIPGNNLLDILSLTPVQLKLLSDEVRSLQKNPMMHAATLLDSMEWFHLSYSKVTEEMKILNCSAGGNLVEQQLLFLQKIVGKTELTRSVAFWKKTMHVESIREMVQTELRENAAHTMAMSAERNDSVRCRLFGYRA